MNVVFVQNGYAFEYTPRWVAFDESSKMCYNTVKENYLPAMRKRDYEGGYSHMKDLMNLIAECKRELDNIEIPYRTVKN